MGTLIQDLRYSLRMLLKRPGLSLVAVLTLALGIGANTAIFSVVNAVLLRPLPFRNPEQLVWVWSTRTDRDKAFFSIPNFTDTRDQNRTLDQMAAYANWGANLTDGGEAERLQGVRLTPNALQMLGVEAALGRTLMPEDGASASQRVVVLGYGLWQRRFGSDSSLLGRTLTLNGEAYTVVGVLPQSFTLPGAEVEMASPLVLETDARRTERGSNFLRAFARIKPGVTLGQAQADLAAITERLRAEHPEENAKLTAPRVVGLHDEIVGGYRKSLWLVLGAVGLVLAIGCTNLANLLLARATTRHKEMAVRAVLGASRRRLVRQLLTESILLATVGGALALLLTSWGVDALLALSPQDLPRLQEVSIDGRLLGFTLIVSLLAGVGFGLIPALQASRVDLNEELKGEARGLTGSAGRSRTRSILIVSEIALSLVLLISAGLLVKSFLLLQRVSPGFDAENLLLVRLSLPQAKYQKREQVADFYEKLAPRIESLPGVRGVGAASVLPLSGMNARADFTIVGRALLSAQDAPGAQNRWVSPGYFHLMSIPLLQGREFTRQDGPDSPGVVVIDEALAARYWPNQNPLGARLRIDDGGAAAPREVEVVGVVGQVKHVGLEDEPTPTVYAPFEQVPPGTVSFLINNMSLVVRTDGDPLGSQGAVRREVQGVDRDVPASSVKTMEQALSSAVAPRRFSLLLLAVFASAALVLAAMGIYAVISYSVTQRTHEIGIRMALGAQASDVLKMVLGQGLKLILLGLLTGLAASLALTRLMSSLLYGVSTVDPATFILVSLLLAFVALVACYIPARRSTKVDPMEALRYE
ncbi:MAG TPA: ABC transporter permease [Pyrinomonadaceae bacterium]